MHTLALSQVIMSTSHPYNKLAPKLGRDIYMLGELSNAHTAGSFAVHACNQSSIILFINSQNTCLHERGCIAARFLQLGAVGFVPLAPPGLGLGCALTEAVCP